MLRYLNAGESHGQALVAVLEGLPAGLPVTAEAINSRSYEKAGVDMVVAVGCELKKIRSNSRVGFEREKHWGTLWV